MHRRSPQRIAVFLFILSICSLPCASAQDLPIGPAELMQGLQAVGTSQPQELSALLGTLGPMLASLGMQAPGGTPDLSGLLAAVFGGTGLESLLKGAQTGGGSQLLEGLEALTKSSFGTGAAPVPHLSPTNQPSKSAGTATTAHGRSIYKTVEVVNGRSVPRYSDTKPSDGTYTSVVAP